MLWIRIAFNADPDTDPDPAFYLNADPDPDPGSQTYAGPCGSESGSRSDIKATKSWNLNIKNKLTVKNRSKTSLRRSKIIFEMQETMFIW